jgi:ribonuclease PH
MADQSDSILLPVRPDGRSYDQLRPLRFTPGIAPNADGSVLIATGNTQVVCAATVEPSVPRWMKEQGVTGGWITAEYSMLPYSTLTRRPRDISKGRLDGRSVEIQRLIGRSLRAAVDLDALGERTLWVDCDVLQADGGTRTASITGASVAVALACAKLRARGQLTRWPLRCLVAAVSVGAVKQPSHDQQRCFCRSAGGGRRSDLFASGARSDDRDGRGRHPTSDRKPARIVTSFGCRSS